MTCQAINSIVGGTGTSISTSAVQMKNPEANQKDAALFQFAPGGVPVSPELGGSFHQMT